MFSALANLFRRDVPHGAPAGSGPSLPLVDPVSEICRFLSDFLGIAGVAPSTQLGVDCPFDSFAVQDVLSFLEVRFGVVVDAGRLTMADFATPTHIASLLRE